MICLSSKTYSTGQHLDAGPCYILLEKRFISLRFNISIDVYCKLVCGGGGGEGGGAMEGAGRTLSSWGYINVKSKQKTVKKRVGCYFRENSFARVKLD